MDQLAGFLVKHTLEGKVVEVGQQSRCLLNVGSEGYFDVFRPLLELRKERSWCSFMFIVGRNIFSFFGLNFLSFLYCFASF